MVLRRTEPEKDAPADVLVRLRSFWTGEGLEQSDYAPADILIRLRSFGTGEGLEQSEHAPAEPLVPVTSPESPS